MRVVECQLQCYCQAACIHRDTELSANNTRLKFPHLVLNAWVASRPVIQGILRTCSAQSPQGDPKCFRKYMSAHMRRRGRLDGHAGLSDDHHSFQPTFLDPTKALLHLCHAPTHSLFLGGCVVRLEHKFYKQVLNNLYPLSIAQPDEDTPS